MTADDFVRTAAARVRVYGEAEISRVFCWLTQEERAAFTRWLVEIKHPLAYQPGTDEWRFREVVKALASGGDLSAGEE